MKHLDVSKQKVHAMVCTNKREGEKSCCHRVGGQEFYFALKEKLKQSGLFQTHLVTQSGCLKNCNDVGCTVAIYRTGETPKWFREVTQSDFDTVWNEIVRDDKE